MPDRTRTETALAFLRAARAGDRAAAERCVTTTARHHNPFFAPGMGALIDAIVAAARSNPARTSEVLRTVAGGDLVVVHSRVVHGPEAGSASVMHCFRFDGELIAELWDVGQPVPSDSPNSDGMF